MSRLEALAGDLGLHPGDVAVIAAEHGVQAGELTDQDCADVRAVLDQHCVRTVPEVFWPGSDPEAGSGATRMR